VIQVQVLFCYIRDRVEGAWFDVLFLPLVIEEDVHRGLLGCYVEVDHIVWFVIFEYDVDLVFWVLEVV